MLSEILKAPKRRKINAAIALNITMAAFFVLFTGNLQEDFPTHFLLRPQAIFLFRAIVSSAIHVLLFLL